MKPTAAFAAGLWTGAVATVAIGVFYLRVWELSHSQTSPKGNTRMQVLQQDQARAQAEEARLKQTIAELQSRLDSFAAIEARRQMRYSRQEPASNEPRPDAWMVDAVVRGDTSALPRLEQAALQNNLRAIDAVALLADRDSGETLTRVWSSDTLSAAGKQRATLLMAATFEANPHAEELLESLFYAQPTDSQLCEAALAGILTPDFSTRLQQGSDFPAPPHVRPDFTHRLSMVETWHASVTDTQLLAVIERVMAKLSQRVSGESPAP